MTAITSDRDSCHSSISENIRRSGRAEQFYRHTDNHLLPKAARIARLEFLSPA